jgi:small GTP-binding protein
MEWESGVPGIPHDTRPSLKIILVGSSGVGKTCLSACYLKQGFDKESCPTVAPSFSSRPAKRLDGSMVILQIWDTAGQERYSSISELFFRDSDVAFVCFDPSDQPTVASARDWAARVLDEVPDCILYAILTKGDKIENREKTLDECKQVLGETNFERFFVTSALTKEGVNEPFAAAAETYVPATPKLGVQNRQNGKTNECC